MSQLGAGTSKVTAILQVGFAARNLPMNGVLVFLLSLLCQLPFNTEKLEGLPTGLA